MANCVYCGQPAGILHTKHADCHARAQEVLGRFRQQVEDYVRRGVSAPALQTDGLTIPHERYQGVVLEVLAETAKRANEDPNFSETEETRLLATLQNAGFGNGALSDSPDLERLHRAGVLRDLRNGVLPQRCTFGSGVVLSKGEVPVWGFERVPIYERRQHREWVGGSCGYSVRLAKGFWVHQSAHRGRSVSYESDDLLGSGDFFISNKNLYVTVGGKISKFALKRLVNVQFYKDGLELQVDGARPRQFQVRLREPDAWLASSILCNVQNLEDAAPERARAKTRKAAAAAPPVGVADEIAKLAALYERGLLTEAEFTRQKGALLAGHGP
jgi:hypothetical protein